VVVRSNRIVMDDDTPEVVFERDGVVLLRRPDGSRELRLSGRVLDSLEAAFDAIVAAVWLSAISEPPDPLRPSA